MVTEPSCFTNGSALPEAFFGLPYSQTLIPVLGVPGSFLLMGSIPSGLTLNSSSGLISGTPNNGGQVGTTFNFSVTFTPTDPLLSPCNQAFTLPLGVYCVGVEDLTWGIVHSPAEGESSMVMAGGDGSFTITGDNNDTDIFFLTSSTLLCQPVVFSEYPATIELDFNINLHESADPGSQAGVHFSARRNGTLLAPQFNRATSGPDIIESGTVTIATGMLQAGASYTFVLEISSNCVNNATASYIGTIRIRPLTPP